MQVTVLRKTEYEGLFVYIMQFDTVFQYLFSLNGEIYQNRIELKPNWKRLFMFRLGRRNTPYTPDEIDDGEQILLSGAMTTIDEQKSKGGLSRQARKSKMRQIAKVKTEVKTDYESRKDIECQWQSRETNDGWYYICLIHRGGVVKMVDGEKPKHKHN